MAKYYWWKGATAPFTTQTSGTTYAAWIAATNAGLTSNWVSSSYNVSSLVYGATALPGSSDYVSIDDRYPPIGSTVGSLTLDILSPCLNSTGVGITAFVCSIGPFTNYRLDSGALPITYNSRVGGPVQGNSGVSEVAGITGATLCGVPLEIRASYKIYVYDNDTGSFDVNIAPSNVPDVRVTRIGITGSAPLTAMSLGNVPWKRNTALRIYGASGGVPGATLMIVESGVVISEMVIGNGVIIPAAAGVTASPVLSIYGQVFDFTMSAGTATDVDHVLVAPNIRCFDQEASGNYKFRSSITRTGNTDALSPQTNINYADLILLSSMRYMGILTGELKSYDVTLGENAYDAEPAYSTSYKFATGGDPLIGPNIKLRGTIGYLKDFYMTNGTITIDPTSSVGQYGLICGNGKIGTLGVCDFGGDVKISPESFETTPGSIGVVHGLASEMYGLRLTDNAISKFKYPKNATVETHTNSPYPIL